MAGIGFVLRKLTYKDNLMGIVAGFGYSTLIATGPWLFTIVALLGSGALVNTFSTPEQNLIFQSIIIYNFSFSLVFTGPLSMVVTRYLADQIYEKKNVAIPGALLGSMLMLSIVQFPFVAIFYFVYVESTLAVQIFGLVNYILIANIWLVIVFVSALKAYHIVVRAFFVGMMIGMVSNVLLGIKFGSAGMLMAFNIGLSYILFSMIARVFAEHPYSIFGMFNFLPYFKKFWDLALSGLLINAAAWADKWIMWFSPFNTHVAGSFVSSPLYDSAMFMAYLTIIPALSIFLFSMETEFYERYLGFYRSLSQHLPLTVIQKKFKEMTASIHKSGINYLVIQGMISFTVILLAPTIFDQLNVNYLGLGIFRYGVLGAFFHIMIQFLSIVLSYFDFRRDILIVSLIYLLTNGFCTWLFMQQGFAYYGYGYALASIISFAVAYLITFYKVRDILYQTFIVKNSSV